LAAPASPPQKSITRPIRIPYYRGVNNPVLETFFSVEVADMARATVFYREALGALVMTALPFWTSLNIAGVRIGLALNPQLAGARVGLHFAVANLGDACASVERAGGRILHAHIEVAPGVVVAEVADSEGNRFVLAAR
jgi:predicted enzyme related to lactoylglutathione lyase